MNNGTMNQGPNQGLLVVDLQEGFVSKNTEQAAHEIKRLLEGEIFDPVVFSRFRNSPRSPHWDILNWQKLTTEEEIQLWSGIAEHAKDVFDKASYTALTPEFRERLKLQGAKTVFLAGLDTECCVLKTASDLFESGIRAVVLADFCASNGGEDSHRAGIMALARIIGHKNIVQGIRDLTELRDYVQRNYGGNTPIILPDNSE